MLGPVVVTLTRDTGTPERAAFWASVRESAREAEALPPWALAGIDLNPAHFETYAPQGEP